MMYFKRSFTRRLPFALCLALPWLMSGANAQPKVRYTLPPAPELTASDAPARSVELDGFALDQRGELPGEFDDTDHDGVPDIDDKCPNTAHELAHKHSLETPLVDHCGCSFEEEPLLDEPEVQRRLATLTTEDTVNFGFDESRLSANAIRLLEDYLARVQGQPLAVLIEGHTDFIGSSEYNQRLSERRAQAVQRWLRRRGINTEVVQSAGFGESRPKVDNSSAENRMQNRRVEMRIRYEAEVLEEQPTLPVFDDPTRFLEIDCPDAAIELGANGQRMLNKLAAYLLMNQSTQLRIFGQTGEQRLTRDQRNKIARARSSYVRGYLAELGVPAGRLLPLWGSEVAAGRCISMTIGELPEPQS